MNGGVKTALPTLPADTETTTIWECDSTSEKNGFSGSWNVTETPSPFSAAAPRTDLASNPIIGGFRFRPFQIPASAVQSETREPNGLVSTSKSWFFRQILISFGQFGRSGLARMSSE